MQENLPDQKTRIHLRPDNQKQNENIFPEQMTLNPKNKISSTLTLIRRNMQRYMMHAISQNVLCATELSRKVQRHDANLLTQRSDRNV